MKGQRMTSSIARARPEFFPVVVELLPPHEPFVPSWSSSSSSFVVVCLWVDCANAAEFRALPKTLEYEGKLCGLTGWDSDRRRAFYKSGLPLARPPSTS